MANSNPIVKNNVTITGNTEASKTILFGNGFGTTQSVWKTIMQPFMANYRIVLYDMTGSGGSDMDAYSPNKYDNLGTYADDLLDICEALNLRDTIMVSHSVSGMIGLLAAIKGPQYFSKVVMIGASPRYLNDENYVGGFTQEALDGLYQAMETNYYAWVSGFAPMVMSNEEKPELAEEFAKSLASMRPDIAISVARTIFQSDYRNVVSQLAKPTLIIQTESDVAVPNEVSVYLNTQIADSKLVTVATRGHFPHISAPNEVIYEIQQFI